MDFTTLEKRRVASEAEVRLNRRLAESVYLGVVPIAEASGTTASESFELNGAGDVVEWVVHSAD